MYIDHLKRGAEGILSHDEGYFGSQEGFCTLQKRPIDHSDLMFIGVYVHLATLKDIQISIHTLLIENYSVYIKEHKT